MELINKITKIIITLEGSYYKMFKQLKINRILLMTVIFVIATGWGSKNATTMEYRSAKTAARSERDLNRAEELRRLQEIELDDLQKQADEAS